VCIEYKENGEKVTHRIWNKTRVVVTTYSGQNQSPFIGYTTTNLGLITSLSTIRRADTEQFGGQPGNWLFNVL